MAKRKSVIFNVPKPCQEDWDKMTPNERGKHCASCNKTVIDFSNYTDKELVEFIKTIKGNICGRFGFYQLGRAIQSDDEPNSTLWQRLFMGTALATSIASCQNSTNTNQQTQQIIQNDTPANRHSKNDTHGNYISGTIITSKKHSVDSIRVILFGTNFSAYSDSNGHFKINVPDSIIGKSIQLMLVNSLAEFKMESVRINQLPFNKDFIIDDTSLRPPMLTGFLGPPPGPHNPNTPYTVVDKMPEFKMDISTYLSKHIKYPQKAIDIGAHGTVYVTFVIEESGKVNDVRILRGVNTELDNEAARVISEMPEWIPGKLKGKAVRVQYNIPINFEINDDEKK